MKTASFKQAPAFTASPGELFQAWLDSKRHGQMIGGKAIVDPKVGGSFHIWNDYATGVNLEIDASKHRIVQTWRDNAGDWPEGHFSKITLQFVADRRNPKLTRIRFWHSDIPAEHADELAQGWKDYYWKPMQAYWAK